ncbi:MAG: ATP-binding protein [Maritimibacter sp.]
MTPDEMISAIPIPCIHVSLQGRVDALNEKAVELFGAAIRGRHYITAFRQPALLDRVEEAMAHGKSVTGRYIGRQAGRDTSYDVSVAPVMEGGQPAGYMMVFLDITHQEEAGERRSEFVANVSHELRTPLTAINGFIETLRGPAKDDPEARDQFLAIMEREAQRMIRLVEDLLLLTRVEDVERMRPSEPVDIASLVRSVASGLTPQAEAKQARVILDGCEGEKPAPGDSDQLTQLLTNLIENAIKYGRDGGQVTVRLEQLENAVELRGPGLKISVSDDGEGIAERHLGRLTERFYRVDSHRSRGVGGTGLGLAIVKHIVSRHRGRLRIESQLGQGSTFSVFLPYN